MSHKITPSVTNDHLKPLLRSSSLWALKRLWWNWGFNHSGPVLLLPTWPERTVGPAAALGTSAQTSPLTCMSSCCSAPQRRYSSSVIVQRRARIIFSHHSHSVTGPFSWEIKACCVSGRGADSPHKLRLMGSSRKVSELNTDSSSYAVISDTGRTNRTSCTFTAEPTCLLHKAVDDVMVVMSIFYIQSDQNFGARAALRLSAEKLV